MGVLKNFVVTLVSELSKEILLLLSGVKTRKEILLFADGWAKIKEGNSFIAVGC